MLESRMTRWSILSILLTFLLQSAQTFVVGFILSQTTLQKDHKSRIRNI